MLKYSADYVRLRIQSLTIFKQKKSFFIIPLLTSDYSVPQQVTKFPAGLIIAVDLF
jgi:hypothetical protein